MKPINEQSVPIIFPDFNMKIDDKMSQKVDTNLMTINNYNKHNNPFIESKIETTKVNII